MAFGIGEAIGGALGFIGGERTNRANQRMAQSQMDFQKYMSDTAHQREVKDLKAAGLNPILSGMGGSGASTPAGTSAQMEDSLSKGVSSAMALRSLRKDLDQTDSQIALNKAAEETQQTQREVNSALADKTHAENFRTAHLNKNINEQVAADAAEARARKAGAEADEAHAKINKKMAVPDAILNRAGQVTGVVSNATSVGRLLRKPPPPPAPKSRNYNEYKVHPGTGEVYQERQIRYQD